MTPPFIEKLINPLFYDPTIDKSINQDKTYKEICEIFGVNSLELHPLQYQENDTVNFSNGPRIFWTKFNGDLVKVRICKSHDEAESIIKRVEFARDISIPVCAPIKAVKKYSIFKYELGDILNENLDTEHVNEISNIQSRMNNIKFDKDTNIEISSKVDELCSISIKYLQRGLGHESINNLKKVINKKPKIIATYDHQDYGIHNIIKTPDSRILVVDEEAFGILPLGYGVIRPVFDRPKYRVSKNTSIEEYLKNHSEESREYILNNLNFFLALFILRNSYRRLRAGNHIAAQKLLAEARDL